MPAIVTVLAKHIDVIGMVKKSPKFYYQYNGYVLDLMAKQLLNLAKEIQCRDFDALIAHTTIVFMRKRQFNPIFSKSAGRGMMSAKNEEATSWSNHPEPSSLNKNVATGNSTSTVGKRQGSRKPNIAGDII